MTNLFSGVPRTLVIALCAIFLGAPTSVSSLRFRALWRLHHSHYHQKPVHPWTSSTSSPLSLSFRARDCVFAVLESVRSESPPSDVLDLDMPSQETADACLLVLTHEALESIILVDVETPIYYSLDDTRVFISVSMTFLLEQGLEIELGFVKLEKAPLLLLIGAKASALDVSERAQALERVAGRHTDRRGSRGSKSWDPRQRIRAESLDAVEVHIIMFSSRHSFRGQSVHTSCGCKCVPHCDQHRWEQQQRVCHSHSSTKRHASQQWRHEQQLSSIGLRRQVFRSRGIS